MTSLQQRSIHAQETVRIQRLAAAIAAATSRRRRAEAAALRAETARTRRQAHALLEQRNAILDGVVAITTEVLAHGRLALAEPVAAKFQTGQHGSTGVEIIVRLKDPTSAAAAKTLLSERFGGECRSDTLTVL